MIPVEVPQWETCQVEYHYQGLTNTDVKAMKKAQRKISRVTGYTFVKGSQGIEIHYQKLPNKNYLGMGGYYYYENTIVSGFVHLSKSHKYSLTKKEKTALFMHEVSHSLGAKHVNSYGSVLSPVLPPRQTWTAQDRKELKSIKCN